MLLIAAVASGCGDDGGGAGADASVDPGGDGADAGTDLTCVAIETGSNVAHRMGGQTVELPFVIAGGVLNVGPARSAALSADFSLEIYFSDVAEWSASDLQTCSLAGPANASCAERQLVSARVIVEQGNELGDHPATIYLLDGSEVEGMVTIDAIADDPFETEAGVMGSIFYRKGSLMVSGDFGTPFCTALVGATI